MLELLICVLFVCFLFCLKYIKKLKKNYYLISYRRKKGCDTIFYFILFQWTHGHYRDGRKLTKLEKFLLPEKIVKPLGNCYASEEEAYKAIRHLETI